MALTGCIGTTDPAVELGAEVWINQTLVIDIPHVTADTAFSCPLDDTEASHSLRIVLKNKLPHHTKIDSQGNILQDARLLVKDIAFDEIPLGQVFFAQTVYAHDFNSTRDKILDEFSGEMGCNGTVTLEFTTPFYLWLLENIQR